ncbi:MAG: sugar phosphate isomerase/epimerase [Thermomicrobia bacterium]|nr:sugar phosphate isomerase/epimerase [Thermomicrobia bacterium]MCA1725003.1 sugar phosphate isomerase/epimerase [Thermomicrobia bacterium]
MLLAFSTWGMQTTPIDVAVKHCAALGYDGLELTVIPRWPTDAATMDATERKRIRRLYDDHHLDLCGLSGNTPLLTGDAAARAANVETFTTYLDLAAEWQKPGERLSVSTTSAGEPGSWETVKNEVVELFGKAAAHAASVGVIVGAEPHVSNALHTPEQAIWLVEQVNSPALGIHFDISHFNVQGMEMATAIRQLVPYTVHTHVKDERGIAPNHEFLIPGEGEMDYVAYLMAMDRAGWTDSITVEISLMVQARPDFDALAAATQSYRVLAQAFADAGISRERG